MKLRPLLYGIFAAEIVVIGVGAATTVWRPPCYSGSRAYLLASNAGAVIDVRQEHENSDGSAVVVYRPRQEIGGASRHLLSQFDLSVELNEQPVVIRNSGQTCRASH